jgi:hypothetical protein
MEVTPAFKLYWSFAAERQNIFYKRMRGEPGPWTQDPILQQFKFTNAYRASDRVSQYLIRNVIYDGQENTRTPEDTFFRIMLFKIFNLPETWERMTGRAGVVGSGIQYDTHTLVEIDRCLTDCIEKGIRINSNAYMMTGSGSKGQPRHRMYLKLLDQMMQDDVPRKIQACKNMGQAFTIIRGYRLMGNFLAYQYVTDLNYSTLTNFSEMEFTVAGPGSLRGIQKCFSGLDMKVNQPEEIIRYMCDNQNAGFNRYARGFIPLGTRPLQLIDIQNLFCELDKYTRMVPGMDEPGKRIKNTFEANPKPIDYFYPPKWDIRL